MIRAPSTWIAAALVTVAAPGCSLVLDWDQKPDGGLDPAACTYKEPNDSLATAAPLAPSDVGPAAICIGGDHDFYRITVPTDSETVTLTITFNISTSQDLDTNLYDSAGTLITSGVTFGSPEETIVCPGSSPSCPQLLTGDYIFEVLGGSAVVTNVYSIALSIVP